MIYRDVLVDNSAAIPIADMNYLKYHAIPAHSKSKIRRTRYWTLSHDDAESETPTNINGSWTGVNWTTYQSPSDCRCCHRDDVVGGSSALLRLNRQIRSEALPIFYAENEFNFCGDWAMLPFLRDRTKLARDNIRHARLFWLMTDDGHHRQRQTRWIKNCEYLAEHLPQLESLSLRVVDFEGRLLDADKPYTRRWMGWLPALMKVRNLRRLHVVLDNDLPGTDTDTLDKLNAAKSRLRGILKPKMLREDNRNIQKPKGENSSEIPWEEETGFSEYEETEDSSDESLSDQDL